MGTIIPDSTIYIMFGVPLDNSYDDSMYWEGETIGGVSKTALEVQEYYFTTSFLNLPINNHMYQRVGDGVLRVSCAYNQVYNANYMMFKNRGILDNTTTPPTYTGNYPDKWFYAFITKVEYVNEGACNIYYEIDVIQTWYTEFTLEPCMVERETTISDNVGEHILNEPVNCSEYKETISRPLAECFDNYVVVVANTIDLDGSITPP